MFRKTSWPERPPCIHIPATICPGRPAGQRDHPAYICQLQYVQEDQLARETTLHTYTSYNMSRKTSWPERPPCIHIPATICSGRPAGHRDHPAYIYQLQYVQEDQLARETTLHTYTSYNMSRKTSWPERPPCIHIPASICSGRPAGQRDHPAYIYQLQYVQEDQLARETTLHTYTSYNMSRKTSWPERPPCIHIPATICPGRPAGQRDHPAHVYQLQYVQEDQLARETTLHTYTSYNMSRKTSWPERPPCIHIPAAICSGRPAGQRDPLPLRTPQLASGEPLFPLPTPDKCTSYRRPVDQRRHTCIHVPATIIIMLRNISWPVETPSLQTKLCRPEERTAPFTMQTSREDSSIHHADLKRGQLHSPCRPQERTAPFTMQTSREDSSIHHADLKRGQLYSPCRPQERTALFTMQTVLSLRSVNEKKKKKKTKE